MTMFLVELIDRYGEHTLEMHFRKTVAMEEVPGEFSGLDNIGNTCYMNAVLQPVMHTPLFREFFLSKQYLAYLPKEAKENMPLV